MWGPTTRRRYVAAVCVAAGLAGCSSLLGDGTDAPEGTETPTAVPTPTDTLVIPGRSTTVLSSATPEPTAGVPTTGGGTPRPTATPTAADPATPTATPKPTATATAEPTQPPSGGGGGGGGGGGSSAPSTATPSRTPTPPAELVIPAGGTSAQSTVASYRRIVWHDTGRLVIEDGAGLELRDTNQ